MQLKPTTLVFVAGAVFLLVLSLVLLAFQNYEVVDKGQILPYTTGEIYKVKIFNVFSFYVEPELRPNKDIFTGLLLFGVGMISLTFAIIFRSLQRTEVSRLVLLFSVLFIGMTFLAFDEMFGVHETIGHNLRFLTKVPLIHRPDDVIFALYAVPVGLFAWYFRAEFLAARASLFALAAGAGLFLFAVVSDVFDIVLVEELAELMAGLALVTAILTLGHHHLLRSLRRNSGEFNE